MGEYETINTKFNGRAIAILIDVITYIANTIDSKAVVLCIVRIKST